MKQILINRQKNQNSQQKLNALSIKPTSRNTVQPVRAFFMLLATFIASLIIITDLNPCERVKFNKNFAPDQHVFSTYHLMPHAARHDVDVVAYWHKSNMIHFWTCTNSSDHVRKCRLAFSSCLCRTAFCSWDISSHLLRSRESFELLLNLKRKTRWGTIKKCFGWKELHFMTQRGQHSMTLFLQHTKLWIIIELEISIPGTVALGTWMTFKFEASRYFGSFRMDLSAQSI